METQTPPKPRSRAPFIAGLVAIFGFGGAATFFLLRRPVEPPPPPKRAVEQPVGPPKLTELKLSELEGTVEVRGKDGAWRPAKAGDVLKSDDGVRTQDGAYAVLVGGEYWEVKMEPGTEVQVGELSESISKILLGSGMAHARVKGVAKHLFEVKAMKGDAAARTEQGTFTISSNGEGTVAVASHDGEVALEGKGRVVILKAGQRSVVLPGQAPTDPIAVPSSLLLKVALPAQTLTNKPHITVVGNTEPGTQLQISGHVVPVDATGHFSGQVPLSEGRNTVTVKAVSVGQVEQVSKHTVDLDTHVRPTTVDKNALWGEQPKKK